MRAIILAALGAGAILWPDASRAADYHFASSSEGWCHSTTSSTEGGTLTQTTCQSVTDLIDKETGSLYTCSLTLTFSWRNDVFQDEGPRTRGCASFISFSPPKVVNSFVLPDFGSRYAPQPGWDKLPVAPLSYWYATVGDEVGVCLSLPLGLPMDKYRHFPFGPTVCDTLPMRR